MKGYRDPLALTRKQRDVGKRGVAMAKRALAEAQRNSPVVWRDLVAHDAGTDTESEQ